MSKTRVKQKKNHDCFNETSIRNPYYSNTPYISIGEARFNKKIQIGTRDFT